MTEAYDPLDPRAQDAAKSKQEAAERLRKEQEVSDLKHLMAQPQFRRYIWRWLEKAGMNRSSFSMNGLDMAFKEGNRNLGIAMNAELDEHCSKDYLKMLRERNARSDT